MGMTQKLRPVFTMKDPNISWPKKKTRQSHSNFMTMLTVFFITVEHEYAPSGLTINEEYYCEAFDECHLLQKTDNA